MFTAKDVSCIYEVPLIYHREGLDAKIVDLLNIWTGQPKLDAWEDVVNKFNNPPHEVCIGIVGKYVNLTDSYKSLNEALVHGGIANNCRVKLKFIDSEKVEAEGLGNQLDDVDGVLVPGGFGIRGIEGMIHGGTICTGKQNSLFRNLSGYANGRGGICPQYLRARARQQFRI